MKTRSLCFAVAMLHLLFVGCYQTQQITMAEFAREHHPSDMTIHTTDDSRIRAGKTSYRLVGDTLHVNGLREFANGGTEPYRGAIAASQVSGVDVKVLDGTNTSILLGGVLFVGLLFVIADGMKGKFSGGMGIGKF